MPPSPDAADSADLQRQLLALQSAHPELDSLAALLLLAIHWHTRNSQKQSANTALLARRLDIEHAFIRRTAAELEAQGWLASTPAGGASPALRLTLQKPLLNEVVAEQRSGASR